MAAEDDDGEQLTGPVPHEHRGSGRPARRKVEWDPVRAWCFIRASKGYRKAWLRRMPQPGLPEVAPFPVRLQTSMDLSALAWGLHAWENPYAKVPASPFFARVAMADGRVAQGARPVVALAADGNASLSGLRLGNSSLILKIEQNGSAVQVRIPAGAFPEKGGLLLVREVLRIEDVWNGVSVPRPGWVRGTGIVSCCWPWRATRRAGRTGRSLRQSGTRSASLPNTTPTDGCTRGSSAD